MYLCVLSVCILAGRGGTSRRCLAWRVSGPCYFACATVCEEVCARCSGPNGGAGEPYTNTAGESMSQVTCGFLQLITAPLRGAQGVARMGVLWHSLTDPEGHRWRCTEC